MAPSDPPPCPLAPPLLPPHPPASLPPVPRFSTGRPSLFDRPFPHSSTGFPSPHFSAEKCLAPVRPPVFFSLPSPSLPVRFSTCISFILSRRIVRQFFIWKKTINYYFCIQTAALSDLWQRGFGPATRYAYSVKESLCFVGRRRRRNLLCPTEESENLQKSRKIPKIIFL